MNVKTHKARSRLMLGVFSQVCALGWQPGTAEKQKSIETDRAWVVSVRAKRREPIVEVCF